MKNFKYYLIRGILKPLYIIFYHPHLIGKENLKVDGPVIFAGNHLNVLDQCPVLVSTKLPVHYMAKKEYFDSKFAWFFKASNCICVDRSSHDGKALNEAIQILKENGAIGIFPEGTRNKTIGTENEQLLLPFKKGCVKMALETDATIIPFGINKKHKIFNRDLVVIFGKPFKVNDLELDEANNLLKEKIESLVLETRKY